MDFPIGFSVFFGYCCLKFFLLVSLGCFFSTVLGIFCFDGLAFGGLGVVFPHSLGMFDSLTRNSLDFLSRFIQNDVFLEVPGVPMEVDQGFSSFSWGELTV